VGPCKDVVFNGEGEEASGTIARLDKSQVEINIIDVSKSPADRGPVIVLACAIPKKAKFEFIIEKATELGVAEIIPLITERTEVRLNREAATHKLARYRTVAVNAAKQSQRATVPVIHPVVSFQKFIGSLTAGDKIFIPWLSGERKAITDVLVSADRETASPSRKMIFCVGPEGDFTPAEVKAAVEAGAVPLSLGETVLKVDTAAITVVALAKFLTASLAQG